MSRENRINDVSRDNYWDKRISFYVIYYFIASALNATIKHAFVIQESLYNTISLLVGFSIVFFMLVPFGEVWRRSARLLIRIVVLFVVVYLISVCLVLARGETLRFLLRNTAFLTFAWWIPAGVYAYSVKNKEILYKICLKGSLAISILMLVLWFSSYNVENAEEYSMFLGFALIIPLLFHINECFRSRRLVFFLLAFIEFFMIIAFANRGVILSIVTFMLFKIVIETKTPVRKVLGILVVLVVGFVWMLDYEQIVLFFSEQLGSLGLMSRTLNMVLSGTITDSSGREEIWQICSKMIIEKPIFGWGLGGEYLEIAHRMDAAPEEIGPGFSPHNGIIQNFVCFGLLGGVLATLVVVATFFSIHRIKDSYVRYLVAIFTCASIIPCLVSADGLFTKPAVAIALFLFYSRNRSNPEFS